MKSLIIGARTDKGTFARIHQIWDGKNWDDGFVDNNGRFRVYRPDYPRSFKDGYAFRAHIVWWLTTQIIPKDGEEIHHCDEDKLNDTFDNLKLLIKKQHDDYHAQKLLMNRTELVCDWCGNTFKRVAYRANNPTKYKFCSRKCNIQHRWGVREL